jgi:hypothetical protein
MSKLVRAARVFSLAAVLAAASAPRAAVADEPSAAQCYDAHERGQLQRKRGEIHNARVSFGTCGRNICPSVVQRDCVTWAQELATQQPTVVVAVVRGDGGDVVGARVFIDGASTPADGRAVELDPGQHSVRVERAGEPAFDRRFSVREGDRARRVAIVLPGELTARGIGKPPVLTYVLGGVAIVSLASFGTFGALGKSRENELTASCVDRCSDSDVASVRRSYLVADISLGVAIVSAAAAVILWVVAPAKSAARTEAHIDR